jgi:von Willebrand factor type A domain
MIEDAHDRSRKDRSWRRERALRRTRERLKRLEIETHRIKAELARLEADNETEIADELTDELRRSGSGVAEPEVQPFATRSSQTAPIRSERPMGAQPNGAGQSILPQRAAAPDLTVGERRIVNGRPAVRVAAQRRKKSSPALVASLGVHLVALLVLAPMTYVILTNEQTPLFASMFAAEDPNIAQNGMAPIELVSFEDFAAPETATLTAPELVKSPSNELSPIGMEPVGEMAARAGQINSLPMDVGTLMAGGGTGQARAGGGAGRGAASDEARLGRTSFFGTPARANRIVFLVDNSGSMKQGRMETTLLELAKSIDSLGEKQEFYVVFYSDQAYPMFYPNSVMEPLAATRENKRRLYAWLQTVELCTGGALLKAVELAESLEPQVVYMLSDGDITGTKTLDELTRPQARKFAIHTLGMGVKKPQDAQNLAAIAQANRGMFQMVRPLPAAVQMAKARPIRSNPLGVAWGAGPVSR